MTAIVDSQTRVERIQIAAFIRADLAMISLQRRPKVPSPAGGYTLGTPAAIKPQAFRLVPFKRRLSHGTSLGGQGGEGRVASLPYVLVGAWNADIQPDDYFDYGGLRYEVLALEPNRKVRTAAELIEKGASSG